MEIGEIWANNIENKNSKASIKCGLYHGTGIIKDIIRASIKLSMAYENYGYGYGVEEIKNDYGLYPREAAHLSLYNALKRLENKGKEAT